MRFGQALHIPTIDRHSFFQKAASPPKSAKSQRRFPGSPPPPERENEKEKKIWRYNHFHSHGSFAQKRATMTACLKKTETMASNKQVFIDSAVNKLREFQNLAYPNSVLKGACTFLAATTGNGAWMGVKRYIR